LTQGVTPPVTAGSIEKEPAVPPWPAISADGVRFK
jgi:hypothetical protein